MARKEDFNIAQLLPEMAKKTPDKIAIIYPVGHKGGKLIEKSITYKELEIEAARHAKGLADYGIKKGQRVLLMVRPGFDFIALAFALLRIGAIPILIDPGMGLKNLMKCIKQVSPDVFIAIPVAHILKIIYGKYFRTVKKSVVVGRKFILPGASLKSLLPKGKVKFETTKMDPDEPAAIFFTTGSTGPAKGTVYTNGMLRGLLDVIQKAYGWGKDPKDVDLAVFPLFCLFSTAYGTTSVIPDVDASKPAQMEPDIIVDAMKRHKVTTSFGSPTIWNNVGRYCKENKVKLPTVKRILMFGAPVPEHVLKYYVNVVPNGDTYTPYGATEALPLTTITGTERLTTEEASRNGAGTCVGRPLPGLTMKIISIDDDPIAKWSDDLVLPQGKKGEITVKGSWITREYYGLPKKTALAKIKEGRDTWHRMGDIGYLDKKGRLWFCGRKAHRVKTKKGDMFTVPCETVINQHPKVYRSALVGIGKPGHEEPVLIAEPVKGKMPKDEASRKKFEKELLKIASKHEHTKPIKRILFHESFPVDIRHNAKIFREKLKVWAREQ